MGPKAIMFVAGEASADLHGADVVRAIKRIDPDVHCWGVGGASMAAAGMEVVYPAEKVSVAGLTEVLFALPRLSSLLRRLAGDIEENQPNVVVLIDLPDFNLRLAKRIKKLDIPIVYYISPQVWAWREKRVEQIRGLVNQMLCILPFETAFYQKHSVPAQFVGHPLAQQLAENPDRGDAKNALGITADIGPVVALLPGSRAKEVSRHLPHMLEGVRLLKRRFPDVVPVVPVAPAIPIKKVQKLVDRSRMPCVVVEGQAPRVLAACDVAVVASGTATLQAALLSRPMVVCYRVSRLSFFILRRLVRVSYISLVNLIAGRKVVPELIQNKVTGEAIEEEVRRYLEDPLVRIHLNQEFTEIRRQLGGHDTAQRVARTIVNYLPETRPVSVPVTGTMPSVRPVTNPTAKSD